MTYDNTDERGEDAVARQRGGSEAGHLPECEYVTERWPHCICDRLRAVREAYESMLRTNRSVVRYYADEIGVTAEVRAAALDAAWDAVDSTPAPNHYAVTMRHEALAAIDALRGES